MSANKLHSENITGLSPEVEKIISSTSVEWGRSKELIWADLEKKLESQQATGAKTISATWIRMVASVAAVFIVGFSFIMFLYTRTIVVPAGEHSSINLPDQSRVKLNAESTISFKPLLWNFSRKVKFEGEAYFEVRPGKKFEVISSLGTTTVLGTSFNIYSRNTEYLVTCITGKVNVKATLTGSGVILNAGEQAVVSKEGMLIAHNEFDKDQTLSWLENKLSFTSVPLARVFEEISRQYNIRINFSEAINNTYTGTFMATVPAENALNLVCRPFNLKYTRTSDNEYTISKND